jgi:hypothetical protein
VKFGLVMPTYVYNDTRRILADRTFETLLKMESRETPLLVLVVKENGYTYRMEDLRRRFWLEVQGNSREGVEFKFSEQPAVHGTYLAFERGAEYVVHLNDDSLFHPRWLLELEDLIGRHPDAISWSVYRSARQDVHQPIREAGGDVLVSSICGTGITFSRREWQEFGIDWHDYQWTSPRGSTLDLYHPHVRQGERWCTGRSFLDHTGRVGIHCTPAMPEYALNFVGPD